MPLSISRCVVSAFLATSFCLGPAPLRAGETPAAKPEIVTGTAEPLGTTGVSLNATVEPHGSATTWHVEYGPSAEYGSRTPDASLPPRLAAYFLETWNGGLGGWMGGMSGSDLTPQSPGADGTGGFARFTEPSGDDPNHVDGIGTLHLCKYLHAGLHPGPGGAYVSLGGGNSDLRDAKISLFVRGNAWKDNGSELCWWTQSQSNYEDITGANWRRANWAYTGHTLSHLLSTGKWERAEYRLKNDSTQWTYGGNNLAQRRPNYEYWPIDDSQRHLNIDFFHLLAFVNPQNRPQGSIDFDELQIVYRNHSLLIPSNGGHLVSAPDGAPDDAARLTDGWRHGKGKSWRSTDNPARPQEFVWKLDKPVTIDTVQVHQNLEWPSKSVEVHVSDDGKTYAPLASLELPEKSPRGPNFAHALQRPKKTPAKFVKVAITAGYKPEAWGLGEVELFGAGATMLPEEEPNHVTLDVTGLEPGKSYHYRFVATNATGTTAGPDRTFITPATTKPLAVTGGASRVTKTSARLEGRLHPLGKKTQFYYEYGPTTEYGSKTTETYGGLQITPRAVFAELSDLKPGTTYHYRLVAVNETGRTEGEDATFRTAE